MERASLNQIPKEIELDHCWLFLVSTDPVGYDDGHTSAHCLEVWKRAEKHYSFCFTRFSTNDEYKILEAACLFHEQDDTKLGRRLDDNREKIIKAMKEDLFPDDAIEAVLFLIQNCSFKKRKEGKCKTNIELGKMMSLLCSADLAEAVNKLSLARAYSFHRRRLWDFINDKAPDDDEVMKHVYYYFTDPYDGYFPRLHAITVESILHELQPEIEDVCLSMRMTAVARGLKPVERNM